MALSAGETGVLLVFIVLTSIGFSVGYVLLSKVTNLSGLLSVPEPASSKDLRHVATACVFPSAFAAVAITAGASPWTWLVAAVAGLPPGLLAMRFVGEWQDEKMGPWVGGLMMFAPCLVALVAALAYRGQL